MFLSFLKSEVDYECLRYSKPDMNGLHFTEGLLYASKLEETLSEGDRYQPSVEGICFVFVFWYVLMFWQEMFLWRLENKLFNNPEKYKLTPISIYD